MNGAPPASIGAANKSGWSNEVILMQFLEGFISNVRPSVEKPVLLLMDNHESHVNISIIELAKRSGIILMIFHPDTTHKMQPLDSDGFGSFKNFYNNTMNKWMISPGNAGKPVTTYDVSYHVGQAYPLALHQIILLTVLNVLGFFPLMKMFLLKLTS